MANERTGPSWDEMADSYRNFTEVEVTPDGETAALTLKVKNLGNFKSGDSFLVWCEDSRRTEIVLLGYGGSRTHQKTSYQRIGN